MGKKARALAKRHHANTHDQLRAHLQFFMDADNHVRRPDTMRGFMPTEFNPLSLDE